MSSNDTSTHPDYNPNIKIKDEPGTISESSISPTPVIPNLLNTIKTESGLSTTANRLPTFRMPRDLYLGGSIKLERPKKVYVPNLNAQRNKRNKEDENAANKSVSGPKTNKGQGREKGKGDRGRDKNRGRGKTASNLIQSTGIFSEGLADISTKRHSSMSGYRDRDSSGNDKESAATLARPKLSIPLKIDKAEEAEKLKELLRDDFVDDGLDIDSENTPVILPMIDKAKLFKTESSEKINISKENEEKLLVLQNGEVKAKDKIKPAIKQIKGKEVKVPLTISQIIENKPSTLVLMQLPDCLPGLHSDDKQSDSRSKHAPESSADNETDKLSTFCTLNSLKEGMLGKLQILRSGKARLILGENDLLIDVGSNLSFRQDLIAAKINDNKESGDLVNLGPVSSTLICSPDWENMLKKL